MDKRSRNKARRISNDRNLVALANDTKWRELVEELVQREIAIDIKFLDGNKIHENNRVWSPATNYLEGSHIGPELFCFIEWIRSETTTGIAMIADRVGLVHTTENGSTTVFGYR